jgi:hypothetical protein
MSVVGGILEEEREMLRTKDIEFLAQALYKVFYFSIFTSNRVSHV